MNDNKYSFFIENIIFSQILAAVVLIVSADAISLEHLPSSLEASSIQGQLNAWRSGAKWFPSSYFDQLPDDQFIKSSR